MLLLKPAMYSDNNNNNNNNDNEENDDKPAINFLALH